MDFGWILCRDVKCSVQFFSLIFSNLAVRQVTLLQPAAQKCPNVIPEKHVMAGEFQYTHHEQPLFFFSHKTNFTRRRTWQDKTRQDNTTRQRKIVQLTMWIACASWPCFLKYGGETRSIYGHVLFHLSWFYFSRQASRQADKQHWQVTYIVCSKFFNSPFVYSYVVCFHVCRRRRHRRPDKHAAGRQADRQIDIDRQIDR